MRKQWIQPIIETLLYAITLNTKHVITETLPITAIIMSTVGTQTVSPHVNMQMRIGNLFRCVCGRKPHPFGKRMVCSPSSYLCDVMTNSTFQHIRKTSNKVALLLLLCNRQISDFSNLKFLCSWRNSYDFQAAHHLSISIKAAEICINHF